MYRGFLNIPKRLNSPLRYQELSFIPQTVLDPLYLTDPFHIDSTNSTTHTQLFGLSTTPSRHSIDLCNSNSFRCCSSFFKETEIGSKPNSFNHRNCDSFLELGFPLNPSKYHPIFRKGDKILIDITKSKRYKCDICNKSFERKYVLKRHKGSHSNIRDYSCKPCNTSFYRKDIYDRHLTTKKCARAHQATYCSDHPNRSNDKQS